MTTLQDEIRPTPEPREGEGAWRPVLFDPADDGRYAALRSLLRSGRARSLHDTLDEQLAELAETRLPRPEHAPQRSAHVAALLAGRRPERYGTWVYFPWSGAVVHVLPEEEFRELRTSRNRNKITDAEQQKLRSLKVGIVGLSVGLSTAVTLALEEIGGEYRLADFDRLSLSNMNRLRASVADIGVNKAVIAARAIYEVNPYARVRLFDRGVSEADVDAFLEDGGRLDLLFEECDDLTMKVLLRERARARRIPVLMETSDRGLIDVERFDLEPDRPLLHGLIGDVKAEELKGLPTADKVPFVLDILGTTSLSPRFAGSLYEIDRTLKTWPQLASAVALGGALNADTARRVVLGGLKGSGRFYVDLEGIVADGRSQRGERTPPLPVVETPVPHKPAALAAARRLGESEMRELARIAALAPSGGNMQPWRFVAGPGRLELRLEGDISRSLLDHRQWASYLALGAAVENVSLAAPSLGLRAQIHPFPDPSDRTLAAVATFGTDGGVAEIPVEAVLERATNRRLAPPQPITDAQRQAVLESARQAGGQAHLVTDRQVLEVLAGILGEGDRLRMMNDGLRREMKSEVVFTEEEVRKGVGLDVRSLEMSATDLAGMRLALSGAGMKVIQSLGLGRAFEELAHKSLGRCSGMVLVTREGEPGPATFFAGGRAMQRLWISAQASGLAVQPYAAMLYLFFRIEDRDDANGVFSDRDFRLLADLRERFRRVFPLPPGHTDVMLFRLAHAPPPTARALRRPLDEVFEYRG